eukprot:scaffold4.g4701.t1
MATKLVEDRRTLLRFILRELQESGRGVLLPVGCNDFDDWLLDALAVDRLIRQINSGVPSLDLINACSVASTAGGGRRPSATPPRPAPGADDAGVDFRELLLQDGGAAGAGSSRGGRSEGRGGGSVDVEGRRVPALKLKSLSVELEEYQMQELAYSIFLGCAGARASEGLLQTLRSQLEINETRAGELLRIVQLVGRHGITSLATLEMHVRLLQIVRPSAFDSFRSFVRWRDTLTSALWLVLNQAARELWVGAAAAPDGGRGSPAAPDGGRDSSSAADGTAGGGPTARSLLARLRGGLRRLDVRDADDFDEGEYGEAAQAVFAAAGALAAHCQSGWDFPWGLRARLAELLLRGVFDTLDEGAYVEGRQELLGLLQARGGVPRRCGRQRAPIGPPTQPQGEVWRELGIEPDVHAALYAWVHFRQYAVSKELRLLETARTIVAQARQPSPPRRAGC